MALSVGSLLAGRYEITAPIATGGMGEVWKARDRVLDRVVAARLVKTQPPAPAGATTYYADMGDGLVTQGSTLPPPPCTYTVAPTLQSAAAGASSFSLTVTKSATTCADAPFTSSVAWLVPTVTAGAYAVASWRRGGQTLGMRPWRLQVRAADGGAAPLPALLRRYLVGTCSLLLGGAGFWWAWFDRDRLTWHDRASGTRMHRLPRRPR